MIKMKGKVLILMIICKLCEDLRNKREKVKYVWTIKKSERLNWFSWYNICYKLSKKIGKKVVSEDKNIKGLLRGYWKAMLSKKWKFFNITIIYKKLKTLQKWKCKGLSVKQTGWKFSNYSTSWRKTNTSPETVCPESPMRWCLRFLKRKVSFLLTQFPNESYIPLWHSGISLWSNFLLMPSKTGK